MQNRVTNYRCRTKERDLNYPKHAVVESFDSLLAAAKCNTEMSAEHHLTWHRPTCKSRDSTIHCIWQRQDMPPLHVPWKALEIKSISAKLKPKRICFRRLVRGRVGTFFWQKTELQISWDHPFKCKYVHVLKKNKNLKRIHLDLMSESSRQAISSLLPSFQCQNKMGKNAFLNKRFQIFRWCFNDYLTGKILI